MVVQQLLSAEYRNFGNRLALERRIEQLTFRVLIRSAARTRGFMLSRVRRRKKKSASGQFPSAHTPGRSGLRDIRFAVDRLSRTAAIGHVRYPRAGSSSRRRRGRRVVIKPIGRTVLQNINRGGRNRVTIFWDSGQITRTISRHQPRPFRERTYPTAKAILQDTLRTARL